MIPSVWDSKGNLQSDRKSIMDVFAEFYEQLYSTTTGYEGKMGQTVLGGDGAGLEGAAGEEEGNHVEFTVDCSVPCTGIVAKFVML